ncbi:MAG TPA: T9SS type A sorting domain-containing protein [Cytophagales bacterium]|nr:T9SS type A sorting domain-containing protein [Cytophagales bacterium]
MTFSADGSFTYDHDGGASTSDSFTYQASDGIGNSNTATVTITVVTSDDAPVANPDAYGTEQDEVLIITKEEGVLKNDVDEEGDAMTVELVTDVTLGALTLDADGSFNYTPPIGQMGIDTFEYKVKAAELFSNTTYATININGRPVISDGQAFNVDENKSNGYVIGLISVNDESSSFTWDILSGNQDNVFSIESNGSIKVNNSSALNYEQIQQVTLNLRAHDGSMWSDPKDVNISINNVQDMAITSSEITHSYCSSGVGTGSIILVVEGEEGDINISWSNGEQNTLSITSLSSGTYSVTITDDVGQTLSENYTINLLPLYQEAAVCFITADFDDYTRNRIYVNVGSDPYNVDKYLIYREGIQADVYDLIGEIDPGVEGFVDTGVDNRTKSFRYKVAMRDKCGNESDLSAFQETSHLSANSGIDGNINLLWTAYQGLEFSTYEIYRKVNDGDFDSLTSVSSNSHAYSDVSVDPENFYRYFIAILAEVECAPEESGGINIEFDLDDMIYGAIDLDNPTDLKGKKVVRPRTNQFYLEATDDDGDGVGNDDDQCPDTPQGETVDSNGCSDSQKDADGDGVSDDVDQCPDTPTGETVDASGCSDSQLDSDGDGVTDDKDQCPDTPTGELVYINGCSNSQLDSDGDGVSDDKDQCPDTPQGENVDANGCPAPLFVESITFIQKVYPNPTDNEFIVELKDNSKVEKVEFVDFSGKVIVPNKVVKTQNRLNINVSNIIEGIYLLNITTDKEVNKVKVVIER